MPPYAAPYDRPYDAIVLAGGAGRRLGGLDKPGLVVGGHSLLDRVLGAIGPAGSLVVVGPRRPTLREVTWCREDPPGSGPVAALAAALPLVTADVVVVLAADLPLLGASVARLLAAATGEVDGAVLVDGGGRRQPLTAVYRRRKLSEAVGSLDVAGAAMRDVVRQLRLAEVADDGGSSFDVDTAEDLARAKALVEGVEGAAGGVDVTGGA